MHSNNNAVTICIEIELTNNFTLIIDLEDAWS